VLDQHPEGRPPVAEVVLADHAVPQELQDSRERVADDRAPQVPDVHLLGDVRGGVVDHDRLGGGGARDAEPRIARGSRHGRGDGLVAQREVDEPRSRQLDLRAQVPDVEVSEELLGDLPRRLAEPLGQTHRDVRLEVRAVGAPDRRMGATQLGTEGGLEGTRETRRERGDRVDHGGADSRGR
jgi:hypothetical protein